MTAILLPSDANEDSERTYLVCSKFPANRENTGENPLLPTPPGFPTTAITSNDSPCGDSAAIPSPDFLNSEQGANREVTGR